MLLDIAKQINHGLRRNAITGASEWAQQYRYIVDPKTRLPTLYHFDYHPWTREMHDCRAYRMVGQKAAQMGYSETAINRAFKAIDIDHQSVMYVFPTERPDAVDFSSSRFDPALEMSPHLRDIFKNTKNLGLKRAGMASLFVRSARSRSQLKSIPAGMVIFDEVDEMSPEAIRLGQERASGQFEKSEFDLSTPTVPGFGINSMFVQSDQRHYVFTCPHCSKLTELTYPDCIEVTGENANDPGVANSYYKCKECGKKLEHEKKAEWLKEAYWEPQARSTIAGYHINQMYSFVFTPQEFAVKVLDAQRSEEAEQEFWNSNVGLPHIVKGARINDGQIDSCTGNYTTAQSGSPNQFICMGIDVGNKLHVEITEYLLNPDASDRDVNLSTQAHVLCACTRDEFEEIDQLVYQYNVNGFVCDRQPEQRKAKELCNRFPGISWVCVTTGDKITGRDIVEHDWGDEMAVSIDKTSWMDTALGRFKADRIRVPLDIGLEYRDHIKEPIRVYKKNNQGQPRGVYLSAEPDHFAMARTYCEVAFKLSMMGGQNKDVN